MKIERRNEDEQKVTIPPAPPAPFRIGCYRPASEPFYVLCVLAYNGLSLGPVHRMGEPCFEALLRTLDMAPELFTPLYGQLITLENLQKQVTL